MTFSCPVRVFHTEGELERSLHAIEVTFTIVCIILRSLQFSLILHVQSRHTYSLCALCRSNPSRVAMLSFSCSPVGRLLTQNALAACSTVLKESRLPTGLRVARQCRSSISSSSFVRMCSNPPGTAEDSVMAAVERKLESALEPTRLMVTPTYGDPNGSHVSIEVVSEAFQGLNVVKRHQKVYKVIWEELAGPIHAVDQLVTKTPSEDM